MPDAQIRETTIIPDDDGATVRLQISDEKPPAESPAILLQISVRLPAYKTPMVAQMQREAIVIAADALRRLRDALQGEIGERSPQITLPLKRARVP